MRDEDFCLIHGYDYMVKELFDLVARCERCEETRARKLEAPTDAEIERSQAMLAAVLGPEEVAKMASEAIDPPTPRGVYGEWCRDPKLCAGKGYCPRDPNCAD